MANGSTAGPAISSAAAPNADQEHVTAADNAREQKRSAVFHRKLGTEPLKAIRAEGNYIYTDKGRILDACGGAAVVSVGHGDKRVTRAIAEQLGNLAYVHSGTFTNAPAEELADRLKESSGMERVLFHSGGTEAVDSAIKLARQYHLEKGDPKRVHFIARAPSYHGNSISTLGLGGHKARRAPHEPLFSANFHHVSPAYAYRYAKAGESDKEFSKRLAKELEDKIVELGSDSVAAFFAETVVGASLACCPAPEGYFREIRKICDRYGVLLVLDEIMSGSGRTGKMHAWEWEDVHPDIQTIAKGMGGGYAPISAVLVSKKVVDAFTAGSTMFNNGLTYQSHVIGCTAALEVLRVMEQDRLVDRCYEMGLVLERLLQEKLGRHPNVGDIRGRGLFWGVEFVKDKVTKECFPFSVPLSDTIEAELIAGGVVAYPTKGAIDGSLGDCIIIAPPYTITEEEIATIVEYLARAIDAALASLSLVV